MFKPVRKKIKTYPLEIRAVMRYFKDAFREDLPERFSGVCAGFSALAISYWFGNRSDEFIEKTKKITVNDYSDEIMSFAKTILVLHKEHQEKAGRFDENHFLTSILQPLNQAFFPVAMYHDLKTLSEFFIQLSGVLDSCALDSAGNKIAFMLASYNHAIAICYDGISHRWSVFDINRWIVTDVDANSVAQYVYLAYSEFLEKKPIMFSMVAHGNHLETISRLDEFASVYREEILAKISERDAVSRDYYKCSLLVLAVRDGKSEYELVKRLTELGAHSDKDSDEPPALIVAAIRGDIRMINVLLESGLDPDMTVAENETALYVASCLGQTEIVRSLLQYGAKPESRKDDGTTPLDAALEHHHDEVVNLLRAAIASRKMRVCSLL